MEENSSLEIKYPLRKTPTWDKEKRIQWNREYRARIKSGEHIPKKKDESKWDNKEYRKQYDRVRKDVLLAKKKDERINNPNPDERPNYSKEEKEIILERMLNDIREGKESNHPHWKLGLVRIIKRTVKKTDNDENMSSTDEESTH